MALLRSGATAPGPLELTAGAGERLSHGFDDDDLDEAHERQRQANRPVWRPAVVVQAARLDLAGPLRPLRPGPIDTVAPDTLHAGLQAPGAQARAGYVRVCASTTLPSA